MAYDDSQSSNSALLGDDSHRLTQSKSLPVNTITRNSVKWKVRNSIPNASLRRYRSPFRRNGINTSSTNSENSQTSSFPLFRRFYLMRSSIKQKRQRFLPKNSIGEGSLYSAKSSSAPRIETLHIITTMFITITSASLLICMIFLDLAYLNDAIPIIMNHSTIITNYKTLCFRYPKVCVMKALVIIVFIGITIILCYSILILYIRARRHSRLLERKTDELEKEKCLTEKLLHQILPPCVAKDLINGRKAPAEHYDSVTIYFSDIVGFTGIARYYMHNIFFI